MKLVCFHFHIGSQTLNNPFVQALAIIGNQHMKPLQLNHIMLSRQMFPQHCTFWTCAIRRQVWRQRVATKLWPTLRSKLRSERISRKARPKVWPKWCPKVWPKPTVTKSVTESVTKSVPKIDLCIVFLLLRACACQPHGVTKMVPKIVISPTKMWWTLGGAFWAHFWRGFWGTLWAGLFGHILFVRPRGIACPGPVPGFAKRVPALSEGFA